MTDTSPAIRIPLRYDTTKSGFWVDYLLEHDDDDIAACCAIMTPADTPVTAFSVEYSTQQVQNITQTAWDSEDITEIIYGQSTEERNILGVKSGLRQRKQQLTQKDFHEEYGHLGSQPDCDICKRTQGSMRRITKVVDKHREQHRARVWVMDGITWSDRSDEGSKYQVVLKDKCSDMYMSSSNNQTAHRRQYRHLYHVRHDSHDNGTSESPRCG